MINSVKFTTDSSELGNAVSGTATKTFLKAGDAYNLDAIKAERIRIDAALKEQGFYFFGPDDIYVQVDSTNNIHKVDMYVNIKKATSGKARQRYTINDIFIYPNYKINVSTSLRKDSAVVYGDFHVIDPEKMFNPSVFERAMFFKKGDVYNRRDRKFTEVKSFSSSFHFPIFFR